MATDNAAPTNGEPTPAEKKSIWSKAMSSIPIILTVLATAFAGMSTSAMTQSMYYRSVAAQDQSKAANQWGYFQAKRIRGTTLEAAVKMMLAQHRPATCNAAFFESTAARVQKLLADAAQPASPSANSPELEKVHKAAQAGADRAATALQRARELPKDPGAAEAIKVLAGAKFPTIADASIEEADTQGKINEAIKAIRDHQTDAETAPLIRQIDPLKIEEATKLAERNTDRFEKDVTDKLGDVLKDKVRPVLGDLSKAAGDFLKEVDRLGESARMPKAGEGKGSDQDRARESARLRHIADELKRTLEDARTGFEAAMMDFDARRYRAEAGYNLKSASLYEVRVRRSGVESDRYRDRSKNLFYSMLLAQAGVAIATLAIGKVPSHALLALAVIAGLGAVGFTGLVFLGI